MKEALFSLSFDDGYKNQFENAVPVLEKYNFKGTFYYITKYFNEYSASHMTEMHLQKLHLAGHEIGAHSVTHPNLVWQWWKRKEIKQSKIDLTEWLKIRVKSFAYPYGRYNQKVIDRVAKQYDNARTTKGKHNGTNPTGTSSFELCCKTVRWDTEYLQIENWIAEALKNNQWLIFSFHQVVKLVGKEEETAYPGKWGIKTSTLDYICGLLQETGMNVLPISEARLLYH